jgi:O-antigen ligase
LPFGSARPWSEALLEVLAAILVIGIAGPMLLRSGTMPVPWHRHRIEAFLLLALATWIGVQALAPVPAGWRHPLWTEAARALGTSVPGTISIDPAATLSALAGLLASAGLYWISLQACRDPGTARRLLLAVVAIATAYAAYGLAMELSGADLVLWYDKWAYVGDVTSTLVNRNSFATYAGLGLLATVAALAQNLTRTASERAPRRDRWVRLFQFLAGRGAVLAAAAAILATAVLLTHSRAGLAASVLGVATFLLVFLLNSAHRRGYAVPVALSVVVALTVAVEFSGEGTLARLRASGFGATDGRYPVYALVQRAIADSPAAGFGYGTFDRAFPLYRDGTVSGHFDLAHSDWLEIAMDLGLPGAVLMVALIAIPTLRCVRGALSRRRDAAYPALGFGASVLVGSHAVVDFSLQIPAVAATFAVLLGLGTAQSWSSRDGD